MKSIFLVAQLLIFSSIFGDDPIEPKVDFVEAESTPTIHLYRSDNGPPILVEFSQGFFSKEKWEMQAYANYPSEYFEGGLVVPEKFGLLPNSVICGVLGESIVRFRMDHPTFEKIQTISVCTGISRELWSEYTEAMQQFMAQSNARADAKCHGAVSAANKALRESEAMKEIKLSLEDMEFHTRSISLPSEAYTGGASRYVGIPWRNIAELPHLGMKRPEFACLFSE